MTGIIYEPLDPAREAEAVTLVKTVFDTDVAPDFSERGCATFHDFVDRCAFSRRPGDAFALTARRGERIVGVVEMTDGDHVALLFVDSAEQGRGVGGELVRRATARCLRRDPPPIALTVNASPKAVAAYRRMGFSAMAAEREKDGIRSVPMLLPLSGHQPPRD